MAVGKTPSLHNMSRRTSTGQPLTSTTAPVSRDLPTGDYYSIISPWQNCGPEYPALCILDTTVGRKSPVLLPHKGGVSIHAGRGSKSSDDKIASPPPGVFRTAVMAIGVGRSPHPHLLVTFWVRYIIPPLFKTSICFVSACAGVLWCIHSRRDNLKDPGLFPQSGCQGITPSHQT